MNQTHWIRHQSRCNHIFVIYITIGFFFKVPKIKSIDEKLRSVIFANVERFLVIFFLSIWSGNLNPVQSYIFWGFPIFICIPTYCHIWWIPLCFVVLLLCFFYTIRWEMSKLPSKLAKIMIATPRQSHL